MPRLSNSAIAELFDEMAELLEIRGGEPRRGWSFRRAARIVEHLPEPVDRMLAWGTFQKKRGVGVGTVHRVKQMLQTGTCDDLTALRGELPGVRELLKVKGIGASTIRFLHRRFRVSTVAQLETLARSGALHRLPRFGPEKAQAILHEIEIARRRREKVPLAEALATAEPIARAMREVPGAEQVTIAGSSRRRKAMVGDLDILVAADDPSPFIERLTRLPEVVEVLARRADGASVRLASLRQVDLRVVSFEHWGAALHQLTGSKMHNIALRARFNRHGLKLTERGIWRRDSGQLLKTGRTEEEIYAALGLPYIEPELRENLGELEAAEQGRLPRLIEAGDLRGDLHVATVGGDGTLVDGTLSGGTLSAMVHAARGLGYEYLAITDRLRSPACPGGQGAKSLHEQHEEIRRLSLEPGSPRLLSGADVDILADGTLAADPSLLEELDWVVASVRDELDMGRGEMTARCLRALETGLVDCLAHPTGRLLGERGPIDVDLERLFEAALRLGVALEVNGDPRRMDLDDVACHKARQMGVPVVISSGASTPDELGRVEFGLAMARRGWLEKKDVLNARPFEEIRGRRGLRIGSAGAVQLEIPGMPEDFGGEDALSEQLRLEPLGDELRERLQRYLEEGDDPELHQALGQISPNPLQEAFNLLSR